MFNKIQNPKTGRWVSIHGTIGKRVLNNYMRGGSNNENEEERRARSALHNKLWKELQALGADIGEQAIIKDASLVPARTVNYLTGLSPTAAANATYAYIVTQRQARHYINEQAVEDEEQAWEAWVRRPRAGAHPPNQTSDVLPDHEEVVHGPPNQPHHLDFNTQGALLYPQ